MIPGFRSLPALAGSNPVFGAPSSRPRSSTMTVGAISRGIWVSRWTKRPFADVGEERLFAGYRWSLLGYATPVPRPRGMRLSSNRGRALLDARDNHLQWCRALSDTVACAPGPPAGARSSLIGLEFILLRSLPNRQAKLGGLPQNRLRRVP